MRKILFICSLILICFPCHSQNWVKTFTDGSWVDVVWVIETFDKGYLILDNENPPGFLWLIKTDINGSELWEKKIGTGQYQIRFGNIEQTYDGGYILAGGSNKYDINNEDPIVIKLNPCGELEWCSVINTQGRYDFSTRVKQTPEGEYVMLAMYSDPSYIVQLFKFDSEGSLLWKKNYRPDSLIFDEEVNDVRVDFDGYLLTSKCFYPDPGNPNIGYERPYFIKTDTAGNITWWVVYGEVNGYRGQVWDQTIRSSSGNYYGYGWHSNYCDAPGLVKIIGNGQESYFQDVIPGACPGGLATATFLDDTTLVMLAGGTVNNVYTRCWMKTDTMGICKYYVEYLEDWMGNTTHTVRTHDNKFVNVSKGTSHLIYLYKINSNLEFDTVYSHQYVYDSLCPGGVISDTINPDCDLIVGIDDVLSESILYHMKIYPNPALATLTIEFPKHLQMTDKKSGLTTSSIYYTGQSTTLEVYDFNGKNVFTKEIPKDLQHLEIDISSWNRGVFYFRLIYKNQTVSGEKIILQ